MKNSTKRIFIGLILLMVFTLCTACDLAAQSTETAVSVSETVVSMTDDATDTVSDTAQTIDEDGSYTTAEDVALYIHVYGRLPDNFITKAEARALGWEGGGLSDIAPGMCIGGDTFGNYEGLLPEADGRTWQECDINTLDADSRGAERLVYSNDGLIYYTADHYESFTLLYGEEDQ